MNKMELASILRDQFAPDYEVNSVTLEQTDKFGYMAIELLLGERAATLHVQITLA